MIAMETAQVLFAVALGTVTVIITGFAVYVAGSTMWGDRWYRRRRVMVWGGRFAIPLLLGLLWEFLVIWGIFIVNFALVNHGPDVARNTVLTFDVPQGANVQSISYGAGNTVKTCEVGSQRPIRCEA